MKGAQTCPALCDPMDCIAHGILQARILEWVAVSFSSQSLGWIFPTQGLNPGLPCCRWILYCLSHQGCCILKSLFKWHRDKESTCQCKRHRLDPGSGRPPGKGTGNPLQFSCLENTIDRGGWKATYSPWSCIELDSTGGLSAHT